MAESNPFPEEDKLEDQLEDALIAILADSLIFAVSQIDPETFTYSYFATVQDRFRSRFSSIYPTMVTSSNEAIEIAISRISSDLGIDDIFIDYSQERFSIALRETFNVNLSYILETNEQMWMRLNEIAIERSWSNAELARRLKMYYGLVPSHLQTVLNMESALIAEGVNKRSRDKQLQRRIDRLINWRLNLVSNQLSTSTVESSKDESFGYLVDTNQIDPNEYEKQWVSIIDDVTTDICTSLHLNRAPIGGTFRDGIRHPPAYPPVHECRSAITLVRKTNG